MAVVAARPATTGPTSFLLVLLAVIALVAGIIVGYAVRPASTPAGGAAAQVAADNALVDRWGTTMDSGTRAEFDAMVRPNVRLTTTYTGLGTILGADQLWNLIEHARTVDKHIHARTSDVVRFDRVLVWSGSWHSTDTPNSVTRYIWLVQLDPDGKFVSITETLY